MVTYNIEKQNYAEISGLSTDEKPEGIGAVPSGSKFEELDTGKTFRFNGETGKWIDSGEKRPVKLEEVSGAYKVTYSDNSVKTSGVEVTIVGTKAYYEENGVSVSCDAIQVTVAIVGNSNTATYDGEAHTVTDYVATPNKETYTADDFEFTGTASASQTDVGTKNMGLTVSMFTNINDQFIVTFAITDGYQTVSPLAVAVAVVGENNTVTYDGAEHTVEGYTATPDSALYSTNDIAFDGTATASRTEVGTTDMGLSASQFSNTNGNFTVSFSVTDGYITIEEA